MLRRFKIQENHCPVLAFASLKNIKNRHTLLASVAIFHLLVLAELCSTGS